MYEFSYDNVKMKYGEKPKLSYMDTDSYILHLKTDKIYKQIAEDCETRFDTSNYEFQRQLPKGKNKKVIGLIKNELGGNIMIEFIGVITRTYGYLIDDGSEDKKVKGTKKVCHKKT